MADRGCFKIEDIEACEAAGVTAYVPKPVRGPAVRKTVGPISGHLAYDMTGATGVASASSHRGGPLTVSLMGGLSLQTTTGDHP